MTLAPPATFETTRRADVRLHLLPSAPHALKDRARVHFHSYTMETVAEIVFSENARGPLKPGEDTFARLKFPEPALLLPGDQFIIRQFSPVVTVGGGVVLDAAPLPRGRADAGFLKILASGDGPAMLKARIAR